MEEQVRLIVTHINQKITITWNKAYNSTHQFDILYHMLGMECDWGVLTEYKNNFICVNF